jgi:hypothetical protein
MRRLLVDVDAGSLLLVRADVDATRLHARLTRHGVRVQTLEVEPAPAGEGSGSADASGPVPSLPPGKVELRRRRSLAPREDDEKASANE